jgi:predicted TIM-barrel fold metal-dependent hydrolase
MIVDCHTHIFESGTGGPFQLPAGAADLVREMDTHGVDRSIVLPLSGMAGNDFVQQQCAAFPDRLTPLYNPDFTEPADTIRSMQSFFETHGPRGLKIHPRHQGVTVRDSVMMEVLHWAEERRLSVLFDVFPFGPSLDDESMYPIAYHAVARKLPRLNIILAHAGGFRLHEAFLVAKSNPNVFLDVSFTPAYFKGSSIAADCAFLCRRLPAGRVLYGSDFPFVPFGESLEYARQWRDSLDETISREFWGEAAARLFDARPE